MLRDHPGVAANIMKYLVGLVRHLSDRVYEFSVLAEQPMEVLFEALSFSIDYVDAHVSRQHHNYRRCTCETCTWVKDARFLARQYKGKSATV